MKFERQQDQEKDFSRNEGSEPVSPFVVDLKNKYCKHHYKTSLGNDLVMNI